MPGLCRNVQPGEEYRCEVCGHVFKVQEEVAVEQDDREMERFEEALVQSAKESLVRELLHHRGCKEAEIEATINDRRQQFFRQHCGMAW